MIASRRRHMRPRSERKAEIALDTMQVARPAARALLLILWALTKAQVPWDGRGAAAVNPAALFCSSLLSQTGQRCKVRSVAAAV